MNVYEERMLALDASGHYGSSMKGHLALLNLLARTAEGKIIECGVGKGFSSLALVSGLAAAGEWGEPPVVSYDIRAEAKLAALETFGRCDPVSFWEFRAGHSELVASEWPDASIALFFLDTFHEREATIREIVVWRPKMKPGGVMCGHDYWLHREDGISGVKPAVDELASRWSDQYRLQVFDHDMGFWILWPR